MTFFQKLFGTSQPSPDGLPSNWRQTLRQCNFFKARREIADFFRMANQRAEAEGKQAIFTKEIAGGWERFAEKPDYESAVRFVDAAPLMFRYFEACCPGGALQKIPLRTATTFSIGDLSLETPASQLRGLRELSSQDYVFSPRQFNGEVIYRTQPIQFLGRQWQVMVSTVEDRLYKWSASLELARHDDIGQWGHDVFQHCERFLGSPGQEEQGRYFWDTPDGNVMLQVAQAGDMIDMSIFVTSREVRNLRQL
jgi:hypothetical protein